MSNFRFLGNSELSTIVNKEEGEPPDSGRYAARYIEHPAHYRSLGRTGSLTFENNTRIEQTEPLQHLGSFFVGSLQKDLEIEIVSDMQRCYALWHELSNPKTLFDTWEFRFAFYLAYRFEPYFVLLKNKAENLALLPLWYDTDEKRYEWFGSDWQEEVRFFGKDPKYIPILLSAAPTPLLLNAISPKSAVSLGSAVTFEPDEAKYILNLGKFSCHEDYLMTLKKNDRHSLRKDRRRIERQNPEIVIDNFADFDSLVELSTKRLREKGKKPDWDDPRRIETFRQVLKLTGKSYKVRMISVKINSEVAGVDLICLLNDTYFAVKCGYNVSKFPGIGNFVNLIEIDDAIKLGMKKVDFLQNNYIWKSRWFEAVPLFQYKKV